jgi:hypothetical protein
MAEIGRAVLKTALARTSAGLSGALKIGVSAIGDIAAGNLQTVLASLKTQVDAKAAFTHDHNTLYYTETESDNLYALKTRTITATSPITGGGDLSANRSIGIQDGTTAQKGALQLAADNESSATKALKANDPRLSASSALASVDGVSNPGGNVDFVAGSGMTITPDDGANTVTFAATGGGGSSTFNDDTAIVQDAADTTKKLRVEVGAIAPGTTRVLTYPNADVTLAADQAAGTASLRTLGTGSAQAAAGNDTRFRQRFEAVFYLSGTLTVKTGLGKFRLPNAACTIDEVTIEVNTLPVGADVIADVNSISNSTNARTSLYTTQANRPKVSPGGNYANSATLPNTTALSASTSISVDCDQIGSTTAGADLVVIVRGWYV